jgi:hypothetical protein
MNTYIILRRNHWPSDKELGQAAERSSAVGAEMAADVSWIRTYVLAEESGTLGTVCVYQATSEDKVREHAACAGLPVDEVIAVAKTIVINNDPQTQEGHNK